MKNLKMVLVGVICLVAGMLTNNFAMSDIANSKIAVVDVPKVVTSSKQVQALKTEQKTKLDNLAAFVKTANAEIAKEQNAANKKKLEDKYTKQLNDKRKVIQDDYSKKLKVIDSNISSVIAQKAKAQGYTIVLAKGVVLYGGTDITDVVAKDVK